MISPLSLDLPLVLIDILQNSIIELAGHDITDKLSSSSIAKKQA
jgi:hypothetical protein